MKIQKLLISVLSFFQLIACNDSKTLSEAKPIVELSYNEGVQKNLHLKPKSDTIALGFWLRQPEKRIKEMLDKLTVEGKISESMDWNAGLVKLSGVHQYKIFLNENLPVEAYIGYTTFKDSLASLTMLGDLPTIDAKYQFEDVLNYMKNRFGQSPYVDGENNSTNQKYHWLDGYKDISLNKVAGVFAIEYQDLRVSAEKHNQEAEEKNIEKKQNRAAYEKSQTDIK